MAVQDFTIDDFKGSPLTLKIEDDPPWGKVQDLLRSAATVDENG